MEDYQKDSNNSNSSNSSNSSENSNRKNKGNSKNAIKNMYLLGMILGLLLACAGIFLGIKDTESIYKAITGIMMGIGSGICGGCLGIYINLIRLKRNPELALKNEIDIKDERNIMIRDRAKSKAFSLTQYGICALVLVFTLLKVDFIPILITIGVLLSGYVFMIYYMYKYSKEL